MAKRTADAGRANRTAGAAGFPAATARAGKPGKGTRSPNRHRARRAGTSGPAEAHVPWQCEQRQLLAPLPERQQPPVQLQRQHRLFCPGKDMTTQNFRRGPVPGRGEYPRQGSDGESPEGAVRLRRTSCPDLAGYHYGDGKPSPFCCFLALLFGSTMFSLLQYISRSVEPLNM